MVKYNGIYRNGTKITKFSFLYDKKDHALIAANTWYKDADGYIRCTRLINGEMRLHRILLGAKFGEEVDHIDDNKENCHRSNLRLVTPSLNSFVRQTVSNELGYRGVTRHGRNFRARINVRMQAIDLGTYRILDDAIQAYIDGALKYFGELPVGMFNNWLE